MKYKINVKNIHMAEITESPEGVLTFSVPELIIGAMQVTRNPQLSTGKLFGDGKVRNNAAKKIGYEITLQQNKIPTKWRRYMEGVKVVTGVESGTSMDEPKPLAVGWEVEKTGGESEFIWFLYCQANPIQETVSQSEDNTVYSTDSVTLLATEPDSLGRYYTFIDTEDEAITPEMTANFFKKVQTLDVIAAL